MTTRCSRPRTPLGPAEARALLEPYFEALREVFLGYEQRVHRDALVEGVDFQVRPAASLESSHGFKARNFAGCRTDGRLIVAAAEMVELQDLTVAALLAHELGHAIDYLHPGCYFVIHDELVVRAPDGEPGSRGRDKSAVALRRQWEARPDHDVERVADLIAETACGRPISYAGDCLLQTWGSGERPRPEGLR